jgi:uncharacterized membrane protein
MNSPPTKLSSRIDWIDIARGLALIAMAIYHFAWDLEFFGYAPPGMTAVGGWKLFARCIASSFLVLVGVSLFLAHSGGIRWPSYWRRLVMVAGAAAAITLVTWFATPDNYIFFGILHQIAFASVAGLLFLRLPSILTLVIGIVIVLTGNFYSTPLLDHPALAWIGLAEARPRSSDFVPVFPWFGVVLIGMALAGFASRIGFFDRLARAVPGKWSKPFAFIGRHSLAFYLIHQPVLISIVWLASQVIEPPPQDRRPAFVRACETTCLAERPEKFCTVYCGCVADGMQSEGKLDEAFAPSQSEEFRDRLQENVLLCTQASETMTNTESQ